MKLVNISFSKWLYESALPIWLNFQKHWLYLPNINPLGKIFNFNKNMFFSLQFSIFLEISKNNKIKGFVICTTYIWIVSQEDLFYWIDDFICLKSKAMMMIKCNDYKQYFKFHILRQQQRIHSLFFQAHKLQITIYNVSVNKNKIGKRFISMKRKKMSYTWKVSQYFPFKRFWRIFVFIIHEKNKQ